MLLEKHPLVDCDLEEAALWYAHRDGRLAERFISAAEMAIRAAAADPLRHRVRFDDVRRVNLAGFPYAVFFCTEEDRVLVLAVLHSARDLPAALSARRTGQ